VREKRDRELLKEVGPTGELLPQGKKGQDEERESLLGTTKSPTTKKEKREPPLRILPKADFLKANQRSGVSVLPYLEEEKKAARKEVLAASLPAKNQVALRNGKAKSLLLFQRSLLVISPLDQKRRADQKKSLTIHQEIKSRMENVAALEIKSPMQNVADLPIKNPIRNVADLEIKKKVFQRVLSMERKRDSRRIFLQKNPV
jgi:hypothetical protein